jgi:hypothetical protein
MDNIIDSIEKGICPKCSGELCYRTWKEDRGEYQGCPVSETIGEYVCDECGYTY